MAEALVLIGLVANIFQFIEQGWNILSASKEVYHSAQGTTKVVQDLRLLVEDIANTSERASKFASSFLSVDEVAIRDYSAECAVLAQELLALLDKLTAKHESKFRRMESLRVALHGAVKKKDLEKLKDRLKELDRRMRSRLSNVLDDKRYSSIVALIQELDKKNKRMDLISSCRFEDLRQTILTSLAESYTQTEVMTLLVQLQNQAEATTKHQRILTGLMFNELTQRYSDIEEAHNTTLEWIYDHTQTKFAGWLESGSDIFWISGLAGSGKSTLMKYLCNQRRIGQALKSWAGTATLVIASFFFWHQGTRMQKSQQGLLQSLMFQILRTDPGLWSKLCPEHNGAEPWTLDELLSAVEQLSALDLGETKFCFFIDGLDEFDGEEVDVIRIVKKLAECQNIKICTSSRPWNAFKRAFKSSCPSIVLEEHTIDDITSYIRQELADSQPFLQSVRQDHRCQEIVSQLATRAQGVWLWVFLVIRSLKRDLQSQESYYHLQKRIDEIPPRLDDYFRRMWAHIDPIYRIETARILLVLLLVEESHVDNFPLLGQRCLESELERDDYAVVEEKKDWANHGLLQEYEKSFLSLEETAKTRINDRCKDLVRVRKREGEVRSNSWGNQEFSIYRSHLSFLHRTVRDFLRQNFYDTLAVDARDFSPVKSLSKVLLSLVKRHPISLLEGSSAKINKSPEAAKASAFLPSVMIGNVDTRTFHSMFHEFWQFVREQKRVVEDKVIDEFIRVTAAHSDGPWIGFIAEHMPAPYQAPFMVEDLSATSFAICMGMSKYVRRTWKGDTVQRFEALGVSPLELAMMLHTRYLAAIRRHIRGDLYIDPDTVMVLLDLGCDPNYTPPKHPQSVGIDILGTVLNSNSSVIGKKGGFQSEEDLYQTIKILFGRNLAFSQRNAVLLAPGGDQRQETLTRDIVEQKLMVLFGMARARELMELCENPFTTTDGG